MHYPPPNGPGEDTDPLTCPRGITNVSKRTDLWWPVEDALRPWSEPGEEEETKSGIGKNKAPI